MKTKDLTEIQLNNLFNCLNLMCQNADKAKAMSDLELKNYIINSDIYGKLKINTTDLAVLEETLERIHPTEVGEGEEYFNA